MTSLTVTGVTKSFGAAPVLTGVDLEVPAGNITAVLGSSGCGKTTLLRVVAGFLHPDGGSVAFGDRVVVDDDRFTTPQKRRVGYVPQEGALFPHLDVVSNIGFGLPRQQRRRAHLSEMLDLVELPSEVANRYPHELSGGQQQRVALARALAPNPTLVLLDEPFSSLDAGLRESTGRAVARALRRAGATAVLVTHDQGEALSLADHVAMMRDGKIAQVATPTQIYRRPVDPGVAAFVGGASILEAHIEGTSARCALGTIAVPPQSIQGDALVLVRPEQIGLAEPSIGVAARVADVSYYGHDIAVHLDLIPGGPSVVARMAGRDVPERGAVVSLEVRGPATVFETPFPA
jgi:iron(III) transport system ATP-binding protein